MRKLLRVFAILLLTGLATQASAITLSVEQEIAVSGSIVNAEGIAVIYEGANAGIYVPHRDSSRVTVLDVSTGAFRYEFETGIPLFITTPVFAAARGLRAIDVLPNGNLIIGQHSTNVVREVIIPAQPDPNDVIQIPTATFGTINFLIPPHTDPAGTFAEFESISAFQNPVTLQTHLLIGEEGRDNPPGTEVPGEVYLGTVGGAGLTSFEKLFQLTGLDEGYDDISGLDVIEIVFDGAGNIDRAASRILMTDDSSANPIGNEPQSTMFVLNLLGQILETLDGPGDGVENGFEETFGESQWIDAEGVDYGETADGPRITIFFSNNGGNQTPSIVKFDQIQFEAAPEPATFGLVALGLVALTVRRARR